MSNDPYNRIPETRLPQEPSKPSKVSFEGFEGRRVGVIYSLMAIGSMLRPRWLPEKSFPPYAYLPGGSHIPCAIRRDIATMSNLCRSPRRRRLAQTYSSGVSTSSIMVITGKLMRPGKVFGRLWIEAAHRACSSRD